MPETQPADEARQQYAIGVAQFEAGQWLEAASTFTALLSHPGTGPDDLPRLQWDIGVCQAELGDRAAAAEHFEQGGFVASQYGSIFERIDRDAAARLFQQGVDAYGATDWAGAADLFTALLAHPGLDLAGRREVQWNLGMCYARLGEPGQAEAHFVAGGYDEADYRAALDDQHHRDAEGLFEQAQRAYATGQYAVAAELFHTLLDHPGLPIDGRGEVHWNLGMCEFHLGHDDEGRAQMAAGGYPEDEYRAEYERINAQR